MSLKPLVKGLMGRDAAGALGAYNPEITWASLQASQGGPITGPGRTRLDNAVTAGVPFRLRIKAGAFAPDWVKTACGTYVNVNVQDGTQGDIPLWWTAQYQGFYTDFQEKMAVLYDNVISAIFEVGTMSGYSEPLQRQFLSNKTTGVKNKTTGITQTGVQWAADNRAAAIAAGYAYGTPSTSGTDRWVIAQNRAMMAANWTRTRIAFSYNTWQYIDGAGQGQTSEVATRADMEAWFSLIGPQFIICNNSIRGSYVANAGGPRPYHDGPLYDDMVAMHAKGSPIGFQTATKDRVGDLNLTVLWAIDMGAHAVELPGGYATISTPAQRAEWQAALVGVSDQVISVGPALETDTAGLAFPLSPNTIGVAGADEADTAGAVTPVGGSPPPDPSPAPNPNPQSVTADSVIDFSTRDRVSAVQPYHDVFRAGHRIKLRIYVLDAGETEAYDITDRVTAGQVDVDDSSDPDRKLSMTLLDPNFSLAIMEPHTPSFGGLWAGSMIQVWFDVYVPDLVSWMACPVFTGPVTNFSRNAAEVTVSAEGKEHYLMPPNLYRHVFTAAEVNRLSHSREHALKALLEALGEPQALNWQGGAGHMPRDFDPAKSFHGGSDSYLHLIHQIVGKGRQFYYDGEGRPCVRIRKHDAVHDLRGLELTDASGSFDTAQMRNEARAKTSSKPPTIIIETLRPGDPMSPQQLARGSVNRYLESDQLGTAYKTVAEAKKAAKKALSANNVEEITLDIVPVPFLQPDDKVKVQDKEGSEYTFHVHKYSLPLHVGDGMSLGYKRKMLDKRHSKARFIKRRMRHGN